MKFEGKIGTLYQIFTPGTHCKFCMMFKRKGGGVKGLLNNVKKNCTFLKGWLPLVHPVKSEISENFLHPVMGCRCRWSLLQVILLHT